uniref:AlNc14C292G10250 protein n=1 Tax=Albugo laibachii Nc14 TaxID=890382 RepID=F0WVA5_9STRA|nr:AlNc14C292G10250 [Albugo laibachii Nc14]|eukprot:CCA25344.1 AlNc14C292G10250 [Albugo laibachii Nc14]
MMGQTRSVGGRGGEQAIIHYQTPLAKSSKTAPACRYCRRHSVWISWKCTSAWRMERTWTNPF